MIGNYISGIKYFMTGFDTIQQPGIRRYAVMPILINILLFALGIYLLTSQFGTWMDRFVPNSDSYWVILVFILWIIFGLLIVIMVFFTFTLLTNLIGSPFNGPLAASVERRLEGHLDDTSNTNIFSDVALAIGGELRKWLYYAFWGIPLLIISFIPAVNVISPFLWFIFGAWILAIEYLDYPMGNHNYSFVAIKNTLKSHRMLALGFGSAAMLFTMIPLINLVVMPAAVAGASKLWVEKIKPAL